MVPLLFVFFAWPRKTFAFTAWIWFSLWARRLIVSLNWAKMITFEFGLSWNWSSRITASSSTLGCSVFFVKRFWREIIAALNCGSFAIFWTALDFVFCYGVQ